MQTDVKVAITCRTPWLGSMSVPRLTVDLLCPGGNVKAGREVPGLRIGRDYTDEQYHSELHAHGY